MDDQAVGAQIIGEFGAGGEGKPQLLSRVLPDPGREFFSADVAALAVVGTALTDENVCSVLQAIQGGSALDCGF